MPMHTWQPLKEIAEKTQLTAVSIRLIPSGRLQGRCPPGTRACRPHATRLPVESGRDADWLVWGVVVDLPDAAPRHSREPLAGATLGTLGRTEEILRGPENAPRWVPCPTDARHPQSKYPAGPARVRIDDSQTRYTKGPAPPRRVASTVGDPGVTNRAGCLRQSSSRRRRRALHARGRQHGGPRGLLGG